jgi:hypothetical protein
MIVEENERPEMRLTGNSYGKNTFSKDFETMPFLSNVVKDLDKFKQLMHRKSSQDSQLE